MSDIAMTTSLLLSELPNDILCRIFSADKTVISLRVCKTVRHLVIQQAETVILVATRFAHDDDLQALAVFRDLRRFNGENLCLEVARARGAARERFRGSKSLLTGMVFALPTLSASLGRLDLPGCGIDKHGMTLIAEIVENCFQLKHLNLARNQLGEEGLTLLANALHARAAAMEDRAKYRQRLVLCDARLQESLTYLDISENGHHPLSQPLATFLGQLCNLSHLNLSGFILSHRAESLARSLVQCRNLSWMSLSCCGLREEGSLFLASAVTAIPSLQHLDVSLNFLGSSRAEAIMIPGAVLRPNKTIQRLSIASSGIEPNNMHLWSSRLPQYRALSHLDFSGNPIGDEGLECVAQMCCQMPALRSLNVESTACSDLGAFRLCLCLIPSNVAWLRMGAASLTDKGLLTLALPLLSFASLSCLELSGCTAIRSLRFTGKGIAIALINEVTSVIRRHLSDLWLTSGWDSLLSLDLSQRRLSAADMTILCRGLQRCLTLRFLLLRHNEIGDQGATALATVLPACRRLSRLDLGHNHLSSSGVLALAAGLQQHKAIRRLSVRGNPIGELGAAVLVGVLAECRGTHTVDLSETGLSLDVKLRAACALGKCRKLRRLELSGSSESLLSREVDLESVTWDPASLWLDSASASETDEEPEELNLADVCGKPEPETFGGVCAASASGGAGPFETVSFGDADMSDHGLSQLTRLNLSMCSVSTHPRTWGWLGGCSSVVWLALRSNGLRHCDFERFVGAIVDLVHLRHLDLSDNQIADHGGRLLLHCLTSHCPTLRCLDLSRNKIRSAVLPGRLNLERLNLAHNRIGDDGAKALEAMLPRMPQLIKLVLDHNRISRGAARSLVGAAKASRRQPSVSVMPHRIFGARFTEFF